MLDRDQDLALQTLAYSIAHCLETVGPVCTARLLGTIALDLIEADKHADERSSQGSRPDGQAPGLQPAVRSRHLGADQRFRRPAGYPSAATR